jgi:hypothetical protein
VFAQSQLRFHSRVLYPDTVFILYLVFNSVNTCCTYCDCCPVRLSVGGSQRRAVFVGSCSAFSCTTCNSFSRYVSCNDRQLPLYRSLPVLYFLLVAYFSYLEDAGNRFLRKLVIRNQRTEPMCVCVCVFACMIWCGLAECNRHRGGWWWWCI